MVEKIRNLVSSDTALGAVLAGLTQRELAQLISELETVPLHRRGTDEQMMLVQALRLREPVRGFA